MAIAFDIKDPKNQKLIAIFLIPIVCIAAFFQFMVKPIIEEVNTKNGELATIQQKLDQIRKALKTPDELKEEKTKLTAKLEELEGFLPTEENIAALLNQFSVVEKDANVYLVGFDAAETVEEGGKPYRANRYRMTIEAGYHQFATFVSRIMALPRIMSFSDLRITMNPLVTEQTESYEGMESQPRHLTIECMLTTYLFQNLSEETGD